MPVAVKLSPFFSAIGSMARALDDAGTDALVLFNRFYQPDFDLEKLEVAPNLNLSTADEIRLPLLWIAVLYGRLRASLGATRGVHARKFHKTVIVWNALTQRVLGQDFEVTPLQGRAPHAGDWLELQVQLHGQPA